MSRKRKIERGTKSARVHDHIDSVHYALEDSAEALLRRAQFFNQRGCFVLDHVRLASTRRSTPKINDLEAKKLLENGLSRGRRAKSSSEGKVSEFAGFDAGSEILLLGRYSYKVDLGSHVRWIDQEEVAKAYPLVMPLLSTYEPANEVIVVLENPIPMLGDMALISHQHLEFVDERGEELRVNPFWVERRCWDTAT